MGIISFIRTLISRRQLKDSIDDFLRRQEEYLTMTKDELLSLPDEELVQAAFSRAECKVDEFEDIQEGILSLNDVQKVIHSAYLLEIEVNNGGLCQFFANSSRFSAPFVSHSLEVLGADKHMALFDGFIIKHGINVNDLSSFESEDVDEFVEQYDRFPFDEYDDTFYSLKPIESYIAKYAREHIEQI